MLYYIKIGKHAIAPQKKIGALCGERAVNDQTRPKRFVKLHAGRFLARRCSMVGRPAEVESNQVKTLIENNQCYTMGETADILKISKSIRLLVKTKTILFYRNN